MVSMPEPVVIKIEDDTSPALTVIDVENYVSTEDKITNWHKKVRLRINKTFGIECETSLEHLMKWYIEILNQEILNIDVNRQFILIMDKHMYCFYSYFKSLNWISTEGYLDLMEDILAFYLDCEGKIFVRETGRQKRNKKQMRKKLLPLLRIYLLGQEERIHHVLMKMRLNVCTEEAKSFLDNIFRVVFSQKPIDKSDAAFCRAFILNQKWKRIQQPDIWKVLDEMLETMYDRTLDSIHSNSIWKQIPSKNDSLLDVMAHIGDSDRALCDGYFKYMKTQNAEENIDAAYFTKIDSSSKSELDLIIDSSDTESSEFYKLIESCPKITEADEEDCIVKEEVDSDDDCIIITDQTLEIDPQKVVYEILDDKDDDIIEFADLQLKEPRVSLSNSCARRAKKGEEMSFLDSIEITTNPKATAGEKPALQTDSVSSPLTKLQNSDNDSVKSREILSRKFTRKKEAAPIMKTTKSNYDAIELPDYSMRLVGAARGMISRSEDDRAKMYMPHSTISSNNSPKSTESTETRPSESYVSPTSPDISSTCDPNAAPEDESDLSDDNHHIEPEKDETCDSVEAEPVIDQRIEVEEKQIEAESISEQQIEAEPISEQHIEAEPIADERIEAESIADERIEAEPIVDQLIKTEPVLNNNSHTYNIPTVNDNIHNNESYMKNVPCPLPPCVSLTYLPLILSPLSRTTTTFDVNMVNSRQRQPQEPVLHQETQAEPCEVRQNESLPVVEEQIEAKPCAVRRNESEQVIEEQIVAEPCADQPIEPELLFKESIEAEPCTDRRVEADPIVDESIEDELFTDDHNSAESVTEDRNEIELFADSDDHIEAEPCMVNQNETQTFVDDWNEAETDVDNRNEAESVANECDEYKPTDTDNEIESLLNPLAVVEAKNDIISRKKPEYFLDPLAVVEAKKEIINRKKPKSTLDPLAAVTAKKDIISPKKLVKLNGRNGETSDIWSVKSSGDIFTRIDEKQLSKKNGTNNKAEVAKNKMEVIFTHKVKRSNNEVHLRYDDLKDNHGLDDSLVGDKSNISRNVTVNGVSDFDLFADPLLSSLEYQTTSAESPQRVVTPASTSSPSDLKSPEYDGIDDFKNYYLANYQQDCSQSASAKRKGENSVIIEKSDQNKNLLATQTATPITTTTTTKSLKRKRITFAKENTVYTIDTLAPPMANVKSIDLEVSKKPAERCLRILISKMKLKSLASYKDKPPSDLQSKPVVTERISKTEIKEYKKRKRRNNHNVPNTATTTPPSTPSQRNDNTMKLLQIDYDKSTPWPSESDTVHFSSLEETWRTNNNRHHQRFDTFDEGTVDQTFDIEDYLYIPSNCNNFCCDFLSGILENYLCLVPSHSRSEPVPRNPFYTDELRRKIMAHEREHRYSFSDTEDENLSNDLQDLKKVVSQIVDNCSEFINQPAVIPEVEEYEKTLQSEDMAKVSAIPFDLHNLNLRKFSPSPVMNFSSHSNSPAHNFFSDFYNGSDRANGSDFNDNTNSYLTTATDFAGIVPELPNSAEEELSNANHDSELADAPSSSSSEESKEETMQEQNDRKSSSAIEECPPQQTRLPLKKRKHSFANAMGEFDDDDDDFIGPELIEEIIKQARAEENEKEDISYPAKPAISIAEIQEKLVDPQQPRTFKTPAQKKEMPQAAAPQLSLPPQLQQQPNIVTEQYNNHTYNNPTINYHMNNVPYPFFPCTSLTYFPPIILPLNSTTTFDMNMVNSQQQHQHLQQQQQQVPLVQEQRIKKEKRSKRRRRN